MAQQSTSMQESPDIFFDSQDMVVDAEKPSTSEKEPCSWRGAPMSIIYGGKDPWVAPEFPKVVPAFNHAVLYRVVKDEPLECPPVPQPGKDAWSKDYVRMPNSPQSYYPVEEDGKMVLKNRWRLIVQALSKPIKNSNELEAAILEYNSKYRKQWNFVGLHKLFYEYLEEEEADYFFENTLPKIQRLVLSLPEIIPSPIPLLRQNQNRSISLSQWQIACLLANAFFCTFPRRNSTKQKSEYSTFPDINFNKLFQCKGSRSTLEKLKCICHYFRRIFAEMPRGVVTFTRNCVETFNFPEWGKLDALINSVPLYVDSKGTIEDEGLGLLQADFANKFLGGGVLRNGCVQEEIRFVICPELLVSMLFAEFMKPNEAVIIIGAERYSDYTGYANTFQWDDNHTDKTIRDSSGRLRCAIVAIDAVHFNKKAAQYHQEFIVRELNKAYSGFSIHTNRHSTNISLPGVATGNWGCGAFCGSPHLKALIQLMACCACRRPMVYYTFGDENLRDDIANIYAFFSQNKITVGQLFSYLLRFHNSSLPGTQLYAFILQSHKDRENERNVKSLAIDKPLTFHTKNSNPSTSTNGTSESSNLVQQPSVSKSQKLEDAMNVSDYDSSPEQDDIRSDEVNEAKCENVSANKSTFFETISETNGEGSLVKRKRNLSFFDKGMPKTEVKSPASVPTNSKPKVSTQTGKKSGKISDYFQPSQRSGQS